MKNMQRQKGSGENFLPLNLEVLSEPAEPSVSAQLFTSLTKQEKMGKGLGRSEFRQRTDRKTEVRDF